MKTATCILVLSALLAAQPLRAEGEITLNPKQAQALGITTAPLPAKQSGEIAGLPAQVVIPANQMLVVSTPFPAMIEQTLVGIGDSVRKGQPIARLQSPALAEAQRGLLQAGVQNQLASENLIRDEALWKDGIISESRYRSTRGAALEAQAALSERRQTLLASGMPEGAIRQIQSGGNVNSLLTMAAPIDGVVLEKLADAGQRLEAAVPLFKIAKLDQLALEIQAPPSFTRNLKIGAPVTVPAHAASGKLTAIGRSLTSANQTILLRAMIQQGAENLRSGQFVEVSIKADPANGGQWDIPNSAISRISGKTIIFIETAKGFRVQDISVLVEGAQNSLISGPLKGDEKIAIQGVSSLKAGLMGIGRSE